MLVIKIELHSAITGEVSEIGRMIIANDGKGDYDVGHYDVRVARKGVSDNVKVYHAPQRKGRVENHRRNSNSVWVLVAKALASVGFYKEAKEKKSEENAVHK